MGILYSAKQKWTVANPRRHIPSSLHLLRQSKNEIQNIGSCASVEQDALWDTYVIVTIAKRF